METLLNDVVERKLQSTERSITIHTYLNELQEMLEQGWKKIRASNNYKVYSEAFKFFMDVGLYEDMFRPQIPNPVYDNAAKEMGQQFLDFSLEKGIYFKEIFPGDFKLSTEETNDNKEYRVFYMTAFKNLKKLGVYKILFEHSHHHFDFISPPILEVYADANRR